MAVGTGVGDAVGVVGTLVERVDPVKLGIFQRKSANFRGLALVCIFIFLFEFLQQIITLVLFNNVHQICADFDNFFSEFRH